jgi:putative SOS response-associated peptidase YedK
MLASYTFNRFSQASPSATSLLPNLHLLEGEEVRGENLAPVIIKEYHRIRLRYFQWGLIPHWAKAGELGKSRKLAPITNIFRRPSFQHAIRKQRCLIPADSFLLKEDMLRNSRLVEGAMQDGNAFNFAGIYDAWEAPDGRLVHSFAILSKPNPHTGTQMPLILPQQQEQYWLKPDANLESIARIMLNCPQPHNLSLTARSEQAKPEVQLSDWAA